MSVVRAWRRVFHSGLKVFRELFEFSQAGLAVRTRAVIEAMLDVIVDQFALGVADGLLDRVQLLSQVEAAAVFFQHGHDAAQVAVHPLQPLDDLGMRRVFCHGFILSRGIGYVKGRAPAEKPGRVGSAGIPRELRPTGKKLNMPEDKQGSGNSYREWLEKIVL